MEESKRKKLKTEANPQDEICSQILGHLKSARLHLNSIKKVCKDYTK